MFEAKRCAIEVAIDSADVVGEVEGVEVTKANEVDPDVARGIIDVHVDADEVPCSFEDFGACAFGDGVNEFTTALRGHFVTPFVQSMGSWAGFRVTSRAPAAVAGGRGPRVAQYQVCSGLA